MSDCSNGDQFVSIEEFRKLQEMVDLLSLNQGKSRPQPPAPPPPRTFGITSASTPPFSLAPSERSATVPNREGVAPARPSTDPPTLKRNTTTSKTAGCRYPGCSGKACDHHYEEIVPDRSPSLLIPTKTERNDHHPYEKVVSAETVPSDVNARLLAIEKKQREILRAVRSLRDVIVQSESKFKEKLSNIQRTANENSEHLGQQIRDLKRDIMICNKRTQTSLKSLKAEKSYLHTFDWEVPNVDLLAKSQKMTSSQSYQINQLNFKVIGTVTCTKVGMMHIGMFGDFTHRSNEEKNCKFDCTVHAMDMDGSKSDLMLGRIVGDFNKEKEWKICSISLNDLRKKEYIKGRPHVQLKYDIEITA